MIKLRTPLLQPTSPVDLICSINLRIIHHKNYKWSMDKLHDMTLISCSSTIKYSTVKVRSNKYQCKGIIGDYKLKTFFQIIHDQPIHVCSGSVNINEFLHPFFHHLPIPLCDIHLCVHLIQPEVYLCSSEVRPRVKLTCMNEKEENCFN